MCIYKAFNYISERWLASTMKPQSNWKWEDLQRQGTNHCCCRRCGGVRSFKDCFYVKMYVKRSHSYSQPWYSLYSTPMIRRTSTMQNIQGSFHVNFILLNRPCIHIISWMAWVKDGEWIYDGGDCKVLHEVFPCSITSTTKPLPSCCMAPSFHRNN